VTVIDTPVQTGLEDLIGRVQEVAELSLDHARTLPPEAYRSPGLYELEIEKVFRKEWVCIGRADEVSEPGDFVSVTLVGEPLVLTRDSEGTLHVLSRVCRHRWAEVCEGSGNASRLQCPYHHWTYALSGELLAAPLMRDNVDFDKACSALPEVRSEVWQGFLFVNLDGDASPLAPRLVALDKILEPYDLSSFRTVCQTAWGDSAYDWKLLVDNYLECYHHLGVHHASVQPTFPAQLTWVDDDGDDVWSVTHLPVAKAAAVTDAQGRTVAPMFLPPPPGVGEEQLNEILIIGVFPFLLFGVNPDFVEWYHAFPTAAGRVDLTIKFCVHPEQLESATSEQGLADVVESLRVIHGEDLPVLEAMQRGVGSQFSTEGPLSSFEEPMQHFSRYLSRMLRSV
jgi:phenylpropionate dioxygenase-like ring-hydroxylating dioxygenase large terminal subunit